MCQSSLPNISWDVSRFDAPLKGFSRVEKKSIYSFIRSSKPVKGLFYNQFFRGDASRVRIQLLGSHGLIFLRGTSCFLTPLPPYRPRCVGQS